MPIGVKICGVRTPEAVAAAVAGGAAWLGFNFYAASPRFVTAEAAAHLAAAVPATVKKVALVVDADDAFLESLLHRFMPDFLQLHGHERPDRVATLRRRYNLPIIKALSIASPADLAASAYYAEHANWFLFDAPPPAAGLLPGGNAQSFDWSLLHNTRFERPWLLAGGLTAGNLAEAIRATGATQVDVASGVESARGVKDVVKIGDFLKIAHAINPLQQPF